MYAAFYRDHYSYGIENVFLGVFDSRENAARALYSKLVGDDYETSDVESDCESVCGPCERALNKASQYSFFTYEIVECSMCERVEHVVSTE